LQIASFISGDRSKFVLYCRTLNTAVISVPDMSQLGGYSPYASVCVSPILNVFGVHWSCLPLPTRTHSLTHTHPNRHSGSGANRSDRSSRRSRPDQDPSCAQCDDERRLAGQESGCLSACSSPTWFPPSRSSQHYVGFHGSLSVCVCVRVCMYVYVCVESTCVPVSFLISFSV
jgi:hypothetical protein